MMGVVLHTIWKEEYGNIEIYYWHVMFLVSVDKYFFKLCTINWGTKREGKERKEKKMFSPCLLKSLELKTIIVIYRILILRPLRLLGKFLFFIECINTRDDSRWFWVKLPFKLKFFCYFIFFLSMLNYMNIIGVLQEIVWSIGAIYSMRYTYIYIEGVLLRNC